MSVPVSEEARTAVRELAEECRQCFQCGQCRGACPNGFELERGPRRVVRLILAQEVEKLLTCEDVWRCSECGACSDVCPMEVDVAGMMAAVRELQVAFGGVRCPERRAADIATRRLSRRSRVDNMIFGTAMASRGFVPRDLPATAAMGYRMASGKLRRSPRIAAENGAPVKPFYTGCALPQDKGALRATAKVIRELDLPTCEMKGAGCCGHPSRGKIAAKAESGELVLTACPACDHGLRESGIETAPVWQALVEHARRRERRLSAREERFVPYVGCLTDRDIALGSLAEAAELAAAEMVLSYPSLHAGCCGALGGMYRGSTEAVRKLVAFAEQAGAPIVTPCLLCRDNVHSAARKHGVRVYFWPEFFQAAPAAAAKPDGESR